MKRSSSSKRMNSLSKWVSFDERVGTAPKPCISSGNVGCERQPSTMVNTISLSALRSVCTSLILLAWAS